MNDEGQKWRREKIRKIKCLDWEGPGNQALTGGTIVGPRRPDEKKFGAF